MAGKNIKIDTNGNNNSTDDWETDADFVNDVTEKDSRWGAKTVAGSGHQGSVSLEALRQEVVQSDTSLKQRQQEIGPKASEGYGGKFGVQKDRMDKVNGEFVGKTNLKQKIS